MFTTFAIYALMGYCGTPPSVEFFQWLRSLPSPPVPDDPNDDPRAIRLNLQQSILWSVFTGFAGGIVGGLILSRLFPENPVIGIVGAYIGGRILSDLSYLMRKNPFTKQANQIKQGIK
ncbi:MAG TPA: hypothetical protein PKC76_12895 [Saprospiraceae bacterium]|nr:hypothetical protein [Saprospiraceae bacterium]HMP25028.1 hypothetical protein [Saprospiraceae bacterium]